MSHDGIRFISEDAARRAAERQDDELPHDAIHPQNVRVHQTEGTGIEIAWKDDHRSQWTFAWLRDACPCATCVEEREASGRTPGQPKSRPKEALPMFKAPVRPNNVRPIGRYAIGFDWNDGHTSGIYSWHYLRSMCQCDVCTKAHASSPAVT